MKQYLEKIYNGNMSSFCKTCEEALVEGKKKFIITANPEILMMAKKKEEISQMLLSEGTTIVPDGISVVKALQGHNMQTSGRLAGVEIAERLLMFAGEQGLTVFMFGAKEEVVGTLAKNLRRKYPKMQLSYRNGYVPDKDAVFEVIRKLSPDLIIVALGVPSQELLIAKHLDAFKKGVFIGVGGSLDILSGMKKRAPNFFIKTNTEWLYRLLREPSRIKRFYQNNIKFMRYIKK